MISPQELFVRRINELRNLIHSASPYAVLELGRILRQLLLDATPLVHEINRDFRKKIRFEVVEPKPPPDFIGEGSFYSPLDAILPVNAPADREPEALSIDRFIKVKIAWLDGEAVTVQEVIKYAANSAGGVHVDRDLDDLNERIQGYLGNLQVAGVSSALRLLQIIAGVAVNALKELYEAVIALPTLDFFAHYEIPEGHLEFQPNHFLETDEMDINLSNGFGWYGMISLPDVATKRLQSTRLYEMVDKSRKPVFTCGFDSEANMFGTFYGREGEESTTQLANEHLSRFSSSFLGVGFQTVPANPGVGLVMTLSGAPIDKGAIVSLPNSRTGHRQTIGSDVNGENGAPFLFKELILTLDSATGEDLDKANRHLIWKRLQSA